METSSQTRGLRSKRQRQIMGEDSLRQPVTKKRRAGLSSNTFEPPNGISVGNGHVRQTSNVSMTNGSIASNSARSTPQPASLAIRSSKKNEKRAERGTGQKTLTTNDFYTASQLPCLPAQIRNKPSLKYTCTISPKHDLVLALTHTEALIWPYNTASEAPAARDLHIFKLPFPPSLADDPLPLATFVSSSSNEPGILIVSPKWGKIVGWETISSATSFALTQSDNCVHGSIPGWYADEHIQDLVSAEPAGFIATLSSGRVAQITVRDQTGRPGIGVSFMRKQNPDLAKAGIFGSVRNLFWNDRRTSTAIVRAGKAARAQRDVTVCTEDAEFEFWTNNHITGNQFHRSINAKDSILRGMEKSILADHFHPTCAMKVVDFCVATTPNTAHEIALRDQADKTPVIMLVAISDSAKQIFYLVETIVGEQHVQVKVVHKLDLSSRCSIDPSTFRPRICIPRTSTTAYIVLEDAVVIASIARVAESPSSQLNGGQAAQPQLFQDVLRLKSHSGHKIITFADEEEESPTLILSIQGSGIVRLVSHLSPELEIESENVISGTSAKSRIEQAVFFGTKPGNPFELQQQSDVDINPEEIRTAALQISDDIVASDTKFITKTLSSTMEHLQLRSKAIQDLAEYLLKYYPNAISRADRFVIMFKAEKLAAAQAMWKVEEAIQTGYPREDNQATTYLTMAVNALHNSHKKDNDEDRGEIDAVRHWFHYNVNNIENLLLEIEDCVHEIEAVVGNDPNVAGSYLTEAVDLLTQTLSAAFHFREDNAAIYGLGNEAYTEGVLKDGYPSDIGELWTSSNQLRSFTYRFIKQECQYLTTWTGHGSGTGMKPTRSSKKTKATIPLPDEEAIARPETELLEELKERLPQQVDLFARMASEASIQTRTHGRSDDFTENKGQLRQLLIWIAPFNFDGAVSIAEDGEDTDLLVDLTTRFIGDMQQEAHKNPNDRARCEQKVKDMQATIESYYTRFGMKWATSSFLSMLENGELSRLIAKGQVQRGHKQRFVTQFLEQESKDHPEISRIRWINDVLGENDYEHASNVLKTVVAAEESDLWSRKTEICLAKLAGLAAHENIERSVDEKQYGLLDTDLQYIQIQESLAYHVEVMTADAIDEDAMVNAVLDSSMPEHYKKNQEVVTEIEAIIVKLITGQILSLLELVNILTHLQLQPFVDDYDMDVGIADLSGQEFAFALKAIELCPNSDAPASLRRELRNDIWRRLLTLDKWTKLNNTAGKSDAHVKQEMRTSFFYKTLISILMDAEETGHMIDLPRLDDLVKSEGQHDSHEVKAETKVLRGYIDKARLREQYESFVIQARADVAEQTKETKRDRLDQGQDQEMDVSGRTNQSKSKMQINGRHA